MNWEEVGFQKLSKLKKNIFRGTLTLIINKRAMALKTCGDKDWHTFMRIPDLLMTQMMCS